MMLFHINVLNRTPAERIRTWPYFHKQMFCSENQFGNHDGTKSVLPKKYEQQHPMIIHYFRIAFRNIRQQPLFFGVNIFGLAIGLAACIIISHYINFHSSFDTYQEHSARTYRLNYARTTDTGDYIRFASATPIIGGMLKESVPQIELLGLAYKAENIFLYNDNYSHDQGFYWGETAMIELLGLEIIKGSPHEALDRADQIVISESLAKNYFRDEDPIGQRLYLNQETNYIVSAVFRDVPANSHFPLQAFISFEVMREALPNVFTQGHFMSGFYNYLKLQEGANPVDVQATIDDIIESGYHQQMQQNRFTMHIELQPLTDIHLHSNYHHELQTNGNHTAIRMLGIISWFILIIAWANYFNLSSIQMLRRMKETAVRQVNGASHTQIRIMLVCESALINFFALLLALLFIEFTGPFFAEFTNIPTISPLWQHQWIFPLVGIVYVIGTLSALLYSITIFKSKNLGDVMKGIKFSPKGKAYIRKLMLTTQFALALGLILSSITIFRQYFHIQNQDTGFRTEDILVLKVPTLSDSLSMIAYHSFRNELESMPAVARTGFSNYVPGFPVDHNIGGLRLEGQEMEDAKNFRLQYTESSYFDVYDIELIAGEMFSGRYSSDSSKVILNESAVRSFNLESPDEAIGKRIFRGPFTFHILGIVADMHQVSPKNLMEPLIYMAPSSYNGYVSLQINDESFTGDLMMQIQEAFNNFFPHIPFNYFWQEENYRATNDEERKFGMVFGMFSGLALVITLLGILGVAAYTARQREKEIAIRKTLGGSHANIFMMLFRNYFVRLVIAALVVFPLSWLWLDNWLNQFATRINISPAAMLLSFILVLITTLITVWWQTLKPLRSNPADTLRSE